MSFTVLIPARMASSRLPDKPLADIAGLPMVVRVARQAQQSGAARTVVAADDARILAACTAHGVEAVLTDPAHPSGSDRLAQACTLLGLDGDAVVVNVQGDEPLIAPALIDAVAALLPAQPGASMGTAAHALSSLAEYENPNVVKVVCNARGLAQYFSRAPIPWHRDAFAQSRDALPDGQWLRHIGIYAYRAGVLRRFAAMPPGRLEQVESLEQLRVLEAGHRIAVSLTPAPFPPGVDTPEDLARAEAILQAQA